MFSAGGENKHCFAYNVIFGKHVKASHSAHTPGFIPGLTPFLPLARPRPALPDRPAPRGRLLPGKPEPRPCGGKTIQKICSTAHKEYIAQEQGPLPIAQTDRSRSRNVFLSHRLIHRRLSGKQRFKNLKSFVYILEYTTGRALCCFGRMSVRGCCKSMWRISVLNILYYNGLEKIPFHLFYFLYIC